MRPFDIRTMPQKENRQNDWLLFAALVATLAVLFGAVALPFASRYHMRSSDVAGVYGCFLSMLALMIAPGMKGMRVWINEQLRPHRTVLLLAAFWCLPYLLYAAGTGDLRWEALARLLSVSVPVLCLYRLVPVGDLQRLAWQDLLVALWLIWLLLFHQLNGIWNVPVHLDFMARAYLITVATWCWTFVRRVPDLGYEFIFSARVFLAAALYFGLFSVIAIPLSLSLHFTGWHPQWRSFPAFCIEYVEIFLFIALLEELFFRGFLQTLLSANLRSSAKGQGIVSCLFGLFHILHAPFPNWRYVILASIAGWFYGSAFRNGRTLMASSLTHAMVDTVWRTFLSKT